MNSERKIMHSQDKTISYIEKSFGPDFITENLRVTEKKNLVRRSNRKRTL